MSQGGIGLDALIDQNGSVPNILSLVSRLWATTDTSQNRYCGKLDPGSNNLRSKVMSEVNVKRYYWNSEGMGILIEDELSSKLVEQKYIVPFVLHSDHLAAMEAKDREIERLKAMLRKHQWIPDDFSDDLSCPECLNGEIDGHAEDCALAKQIGEPK